MLTLLWIFTWKINLCYTRIKILSIKFTCGSYHRNFKRKYLINSSILLQYWDKLRTCFRSGRKDKCWSLLNALTASVREERSLVADFYSVNEKGLALQMLATSQTHKTDFYSLWFMQKKSIWHIQVRVP